MSLYLSNHCVTELARTLSVHDSCRINIAGSILIDRRSGGDHWKKGKEETLNRTHVIRRSFNPGSKNLRKKLVLVIFQIHWMLQCWKPAHKIKDANIPRLHLTLNEKKTTTTTNRREIKEANYLFYEFWLTCEAWKPTRNNKKPAT